MEQFIGFIIAMFFVYIAFKIAIWIWNKVIVPTGKFVWKMIFIAGVCIGFSIFFLSKEIGMDALPQGLKFMIVGGVGLTVGWKYLKKIGKV